METKFRREQIQLLEDLVDRMILDKDHDPHLSPPEKIDLLERLIEQWRIDRHMLKNELKMEVALDIPWLVQNQHIFILKPETLTSYGTGTTPLQLQRRLIEHLLADHGRTNNVFGLIEDFIKSIKKELGPVDFKRTETGVIRCYTNTRFAAKKLRDAGLLKFTHREAFKMWLLTLPGFVVAAYSIKNKMPPIRECVRIGGLGLDITIHKAQESIDTFPKFVDALASLCEPDIDIFDSFKPTLEKCHKLLRHYWDTLNHPDLKQGEILERNQHCIRAIDETEGYGRFIEEFSASIYMDRVIAQLKARSLT